MAKIDLKKAQNYLEKWQEILRLKDWDIKLHLVESEWRKSGDIKIDCSNKQAIVMLNNHNAKMNNYEAVLLHELLHLKLWGMDQMIEEFLIGVFGQDENDPKYNFAYNQFMLVLESTTEDLTKGFLSLGGENKDINFGYAEREVAKEIEVNKRQSREK
ncbi:hypothetical protein [Haloimpatiens massiliensis]|uniref:hypothetical protein n=1 Tax=Haloimpatiens massiliensis TaxID=1658110 RepID=UPI000C82AA1F|nr:hypothetical protein [Haloimpatiens massiliensis]